LVRPVTVHEVETVVQVCPPGLEVAVYPVMGVPPLEVDAVQDTTDWVLAYDVAFTAVGAVGTVAGMADAEADEAGPVPAPLVAVTVNVYGVPLVSPVTVQPMVALVQTNPPGEEVTV